MRNSQFLPRFGADENWRHSHLALAYGPWAPVDETGEHAGEVPPRGDNQEPFKSKWLDELERLPIDLDYRRAYARWKWSLEEAGCRCEEIEFTSRLLIGGDDGSATEVGPTLQHTWGVPIIPGSALKGLYAHYIAATCGRAGESKPVPYSRPKWNGRRPIEASHAECYRALFGACEVDSEVGGDLIIFHDALYVPNSPTGSTPFGVDVVTSHQRSYYGETQGWTEPGRNWSNDYDSPSPVGFISVKPGARFLLAVDGDTGCRKLALDLLIIAIREWGVGSKTSAGYGRGGESG